MLRNGEAHILRQKQLSVDVDAAFLIADDAQLRYAEMADQLGIITVLSLFILAEIRSPAISTM